jgi:hypothetical protein
VEGGGMSDKTDAAILTLIRSEVYEEEALLLDKHIKKLEQQLAFADELIDIWRDEALTLRRDLANMMKRYAVEMERSLPE